MDKYGYCPICDRCIYINTDDQMCSCPTCGHHINLHTAYDEWDGEIIGSCMANNTNRYIFALNKNDLGNVCKIDSADIIAAIERTQKYIKE